MRPLIRHVYIHVPFCTHICPYCAFHKERNVGDSFRHFLPALKREIRWALENFDLKPQTVFFGGGTPSALSLRQWEELFAIWPWLSVTEFTVEANPLTLSQAKAALLRSGGVNRISLGAQSLDAEMLKVLGRTHQPGDVAETMKILRAAGFDNINLDLMFSLPGQTLASWQATLHQALALHPEHISTYNLTYEEDTEFLRRQQSGLYQENEVISRSMAECAHDLLEEAGFDHYEISNFARPGRASVHNLAIWRGADYLGLGPSACSTVAGQRWKNAADTRRYIESLVESGEPPREFEALTPAQRDEEMILLGLRTREGFDAKLVRQPSALEDLMNEGLVEIAAGRVRLSRQGRLVADAVTELLI